MPSTKNAVALKKYLAKLEYGDLTIPNDTNLSYCLENLEELSKSNISPQIAQKIVYLPLERQKEMVNLVYNRPGINIDLACNNSFSETVFQEHTKIALYNYNVEYAHLKDTGRIPVPKEFISDPTLTANQLHLIHQAHTEQLIPEKLFKDNIALPESEMLNALTELRSNNLEYNIRLSEVNISPKRLSDIENKNLLRLYIDGKSNQQSANLFSKIISSSEFYSTENRSKYLADELGYQIKNQSVTLDEDNVGKNWLGLMNELDHTKRNFASMSEINELNTETENRSQHPFYVLRGGNQSELTNRFEEEITPEDVVLKRKSFEELSKNFIPISIDGKNYLENADKTVQIHDDHVAINDLSPETLQLAISATIAKFGNPLVIEGSKEFEESVLKILAENKQFSDIEVADPKHQAQLDKQKIEHNKVDKVTFTPEQIAENATYYFVDDHEDLSETGKKYSVEINGGYLAFDTKDELISAIAHEKGITDVNLDLTDDLSELYNNGSIAEFEKEISEEYEFETTSTIEEIDHEKAIEQENE